MKKFRVLYGTLSNPEAYVVYYSTTNRNKAIADLLKALNPRRVSRKDRVHINSITEVESASESIAA